MQKDILFIDAACASREKYLLGADRLSRLAESADYNDCIKLLKEYGFAKHAPEGADFAELIYSEEEDLIEFVKEYAPKGNAAYYFLFPYDFLNAEALFKCKMLNLDKTRLLTHEGSLTVKELEDALSGATCKVPEINEAFIAAEKLFDGALPSGSVVDTVFLSARYKATLRLVKDKLVRGIVKTEIDLKNISCALRSQTEKEYYSLKIPFGTLTKADDEVLLSKNVEAITSYFKDKKLYPFIKEATSTIGSPLVAFERLEDGYVVKKLKETRFFMRGTEPYVLYCTYRKADIKNVRIIALSIFNGLDRSVIKSRLREGLGDFR